MDDTKDLQLNIITTRLRDAQQKQMEGDLQAAIQCYQEVIAEYPHHAEALHYLGLAHYQHQAYLLAFPLLERAIELDPKAIHFRKNNIIVYQKMKLINLAVRDLQYCIQAYPNVIQYKTMLFELYQQQATKNYAISLAGIKHFFNAISGQQALQRYHELLRIKVDAASLCFDLGLYYYCSNDHAKAAYYYRQAIEYKPHYASAHWNLACSLLFLGNYKAGWPEHEWRFFSNAYLEARDSVLLQDDRYRRWQGEKLKNKRLLVIAEQGRGDAIQFARFIPYIKQKEKNCHIILQTRSELIPLFKSIAAIDEFCLNHNDVPVCDYYVPLMSLAFIFKITEKELLADNLPYLFPTIQISIPETKRKLKVGIVHHGKREFKGNEIRSIPWQQFVPILNNQDVQFYNFQKDNYEMAGFVADNFIDLAEKMTDFDYTAAMMMQMDLIICTDTVIAHLAGALGKPVWILLSASPDWRWMGERIDSPWYPSARLYRQTSAGDWQAVIEKVRADLASLTSAITQ